MARYQRKIPPADPVAARSWLKQFIRDTKLDQLGLVHNIQEATDADVLRLVVRFPGENTDRLIALEPTEDMEYIFPEDVRARYRPPTNLDQERLKSLGVRRV
jgi:hypothetical protein